MSKLVIDTLLIITTVISGGILAFSKQIAEYKFFKWLEKLKYRIPIALFIILTTYYLTSKKEQIISFENKLIEYKKDSISESRRIESNKEMLKALAEYHLQYSDSLKKVIQLVRDSSRKVTNIISGNEPSPHWRKHILNYKTVTWRKRPLVPLKRLAIKAATS